MTKQLILLAIFAATLGSCKIAASSPSPSDTRFSDGDELINLEQIGKTLNINTRSKDRAVQANYRNGKNLICSEIYEKKKAVPLGSHFKFKSYDQNNLHPEFSLEDDTKISFYFCDHKESKVSKPDIASSSLPFRLSNGNSKFINLEACVDEASLKAKQIVSSKKSAAKTTLLDEDTMIVDGVLIYKFSENLASVKKTEDRTFYLDKNGKPARANIVVRIEPENCRFLSRE